MIKIADTCISIMVIMSLIANFQSKIDEYPQGYIEDF